MLAQIKKMMMSSGHMGVCLLMMFHQKIVEKLHANLISYEENQFQWAADSLAAGFHRNSVGAASKISALFVQTGKKC